MVPSPVERPNCTTNKFQAQVSAGSCQISHTFKQRSHERCADMPMKFVRLSTVDPPSRRQSSARPEALHSHTTLGYSPARKFICQISLQVVLCHVSSQFVLYHIFEHVPLQAFVCHLLKHARTKPPCQSLPRFQHVKQGSRGSTITNPTSVSATSRKQSSKPNKQTPTTGVTPTCKPQHHFQQLPATKHGKPKFRFNTNRKQPSNLNMASHAY